MNTLEIPLKKQQKYLKKFAELQDYELDDAILQNAAGGSMSDVFHYFVDTGVKTQKVLKDMINS